MAVVKQQFLGKIMLESSESGLRLRHGFVLVSHCPTCAWARSTQSPCSKLYQMSNLRLHSYCALSVSSSCGWHSAFASGHWKWLVIAFPVSDLALVTALQP